MSTAMLDELDAPAVFRRGTLQHFDHRREGCPPLHCGWGRCHQCSCQQFGGTGSNCTNCGHAYADHWNS